jgi:glycosylphosphatidylinositol transamidase (GPIT) subunit GPI8
MHVTTAQNKCCSASSNLFQANIITNANCLICGNVIENAEHYLFDCNKFTVQSKVTLEGLNKMNILKIIHVNIYYVKLINNWCCCCSRSCDLVSRQSHVSG